MDFQTTIIGFINDLLSVFPEYTDVLTPLLSNIEDVKMRLLTVLPSCFFDILYQNDDLFVSSSHDTQFFVGFDFKTIWGECSDATKTAIWKHLQLILFHIIGQSENNVFDGDTSALFEAINEGNLKEKLDDTFRQFQDFFQQLSTSTETSKYTNTDETNGTNETNETNVNDSDDFSDDEDEKKSSFFRNLPNPEEILEKLQKLMDGKLGRFAMEIAEELKDDLNESQFETFIKNPSKFQGVVSKLMEKMQDKIKSGEIKEAEIYEEASNIMNGIKEIPGVGSSVEQLFKQMGMKGGKRDLNKANSMLQRNIRNAKTRDRFREKVMAKKYTEELTKLKESIALTATSNQPKYSDAELCQIFEDKPEKKPSSKSIKIKEKRERAKKNK
jgi:hypothetical protein